MRGMPVKMKIKKVMSDGWTIEEYFEQNKGRYNKYYYDGKLAPRIIMTDKISQQYAAYTLIEKDLRSVKFWLEEIEKLKPSPIERLKNPEKMNIIKGLFVSALTFYEKCFTSCEGRKTKLETRIIPTKYMDTHEQVMRLRHNFAAHSGADNFEEAKVSLVLHPDSMSDKQPKLYTELSQPDYILNEELNFLEMVTELQKIVLQKRNQVGNTVLEKIVKPKGKIYWYKYAE